MLAIPTGVKNIELPNLFFYLHLERKIGNAMRTIDIPLRWSVIREICVIRLIRDSDNLLHRFLHNSNLFLC